MNAKISVQPKRKDDVIADIEQQFILRLPHVGTAMALRHDLQSGVMNLKDKLSIELQPDMRRGKVMYGGHIFSGKMMDIPCIIESLKTTDNKSFYKTADISQMLVATVDDEEEVVVETANNKKDKRYLYPHGITPPLKNVRKRRFRKTLKKKSSEMPDIENEVKRLFRMDNEAIDVKWEVVIEEEQPADPQTAEKQVLAQGEVNSFPMRNAALAMPDFNEETLGEQEIFGDISDSDNDDDDVTQPTDGDIMKAASKKIFGDVSDDSDGDNKMDLMDSTDASTLDMLSASQQHSLEDYNMATEDSDMVSGSGELQMKLEELVKQLSDLQEKRRTIEMEVETCDNYLLKERLNQDIQNIMEQEAQTEKECEILSSMLNQ